MKISFRINADAQALITDALGEAYTADGVLTDEEVFLLPGLGDALRVAGVERGGELNETHGKMLIAQALSVGANYIQKGKNYALAHLAGGAAGYRARAREAMASGNYDDALRALALAIAIDERWTKVDNAKARTALTYDLETLLRVTKAAGMDAPFIDAVRTLMELGWDHADTARLIGAGLTRNDGMTTLAEKLGQSVQAAKSLATFGVRPGERALQAISELSAKLDLWKDPEQVANVLHSLRRCKSFGDAMAIVSAVRAHKTGYIMPQDLVAIFERGPSDVGAMERLLKLAPDTSTLRFVLALQGTFGVDRALSLTQQFYKDKGQAAGEALSHLIAQLPDASDEVIGEWTHAILSVASESQAATVVEFATSVLRSGERDLTRVTQLCKRFITFELAWSWRGSMGAMIDAGLPPTQALDFLSALSQGRKIQGDTPATQAILSLAKKQNADPKLTLQALHFVYAFGSPKADKIAELCRDGNVALADLQPTKIARALAAAMKPEQAEHAAYALNALHEGEVRELRTDRIRSDTIAALSPEVAYAIIGAGSEALFTSTYLLLIARLQKSAGNLRTWLGEKPVGFDGFFATLARFGQTALLVETAALSVGVIERELSEPSDLISKASRDVKVVIAILRAGDPELNKRIEALLMAKKDVSAVAFIMRQAFQEGLLKDPAAIKMASEFPPLVGNVPPVDRWTANGVVSAKLVFYPDETSFTESINFFRNLGFAVVKADKNNAVLENKRNGIVQRLDLTRDPTAERESAFDPTSFDIVAHRGHSFHFAETFVHSAKPDDENPQLLFGGSCGSFRSMTGSTFLDTYGRQFLLSDHNTGEGQVNDRVVLKLINGIADKKQRWEDFGFDGIGDKGLALPNDPAHLAHAYAITFERWRNEK